VSATGLRFRTHACAPARPPLTLCRRYSFRLLQVNLSMIKSNPICRLGIDN
jgi:hypothetical protein